MNTRPVPRCPAAMSCQPQVTPWCSGWLPCASVSLGGHSGDCHPCLCVVAFICPRGILYKAEGTVPFPAGACSPAGGREPPGRGGSLVRRRGEAAAVLPPRLRRAGNCLLGELFPFSNTRPRGGLSGRGGWGNSHAVSKALCCLKCSLRRSMTHSNSWKE